MDDTDSPEGGCTTYTLTEMVRAARGDGFDLIGEPRLVRLNPNIPWKTRGNAALSARFGRGVGPRRRVGVIDGRPVWASVRQGARLTAVEHSALSRSLWESVLRSSRRGSAGTDPTMVVTDRRLPADLYWSAVRTVVDPRRAAAAVSSAGGRLFQDGSPQGIVGAAAGLAWPGNHPTWELIAYREPVRWGTKRDVDLDAARSLESRYPSLFLCADARTRRVMVSPHTDCPILYGLRSTDPRVLPAAGRAMRSETVHRWMVFRTNQGTGDHLTARSAGGIGEYESAVVTGRVDGSPETLPGGHVRFRLLDAVGDRLSCLAFEPSKTLPRVVRSLVEGDRVSVWGGRSKDPTFRLEGIVLRSLAARFGPHRPPRCRSCEGPTGSMGRGRGYRCRRCGARYPLEAGRGPRVPPEYPRGTYHPTPSARRHLAPRPGGFVRSLGHRFIDTPSRIEA